MVLPSHALFHLGGFPFWRLCVHARLSLTLPALPFHNVLAQVSFVNCERHIDAVTLNISKLVAPSEFLHAAVSVSYDCLSDRPDFVVQLGDPFDLHTLGFMPALSRTQAALAHLYARCLISRYALLLEYRFSR